MPEADPRHPGSSLDEWDARNIGGLLAAKGLARGDLTCTITSPPYAWLKDYGDPRQIGYGQTLDAYLDDCEQVFRELHTWTGDRGSLWVIADTLVDQASKPSALVPLPSRLSDRATRAGWTLRDMVIWRKDKTTPWSGRGRLRNGFEYVLHLIRSDDFTYKIDRLRGLEPLGAWWVRFPERYHPAGPAPTNVWEIPAPRQGSWNGATLRHACPLPPELIERIVLLSTDPGDVVVDPFAGTGVVVAEAERLGRLGIGGEIVADHVDHYPKIRDALLQRASPTSPFVDDPLLIPKLRALKYPRTLAGPLRRDGYETRLAAVSYNGAAEDEGQVWRVHADTLFVADGGARERQEIQRRLEEAAGRRPASKFGIRGRLEVVTGAELAERVDAHPDWHLYRDGRTWASTGRVPSAALGALVGEPLGRHPVVASNIEVALVDPSVASAGT